MEIRRNRKFSQALIWKTLEHSSRSCSISYCVLFIDCPAFPLQMREASKCLHKVALKAEHGSPPNSQRRAREQQHIEGPHHHSPPSAGWEADKFLPRHASMHHSKHEYEVEHHTLKPIEPIEAIHLEHVIRKCRRIVAFKTPTKSCTWTNSSVEPQQQQRASLWHC